MAEQPESLNVKTNFLNCMTKIAKHRDPIKGLHALRSARSHLAFQIRVTKKEIQQRKSGSNSHRKMALRQKLEHLRKERSRISHEIRAQKKLIADQSQTDSQK